MRLKKEKLKRTAKRLLIGFASLVILFILLDLIFPFRYTVSYSPVFYTAEGKIAGAYLSSDDKWRIYTRKEEITERISKTILAKEDQYFYYHFGVNPFAILRAAFQNTIQGKRTSGASTISMQAVRLLRPANRTFGNKILEAFYAMQLELHHSKEEILQLYLNLLPYGGNIEGIKSASLLYFGKSTELLSASELTALCIIPNKPSSLRIGKYQPDLVAARNKWMKKLQNEGIFTAREVEDGLKEPIDPRRRELPQLAPHLCTRLIPTVNTESFVNTTVKYDVQVRAAAITKNYVQRTRNMSITNAAVIVIENSTGNVLAYVGSSDFDDFAAQGQVDGIRAIRSPGSALKPFVYEMAFEKGILSPKQILLDVPRNFGGYEPLNFDKKFMGTVSADKALAFSLNLPAVGLTEQVNVNAFTTQLLKCGIRSLESQQKKLGLSMILGGCGVTLEELTQAYSILARGGYRLPLNYISDSTKKLKPVKVLNENAVFLINEILTQHQRPDLPHNYLNNPNVPKIAWKTGTSYGRRDAWSIGYNRTYTIGVWCGNFNGKGVPELTGTDIATPLLFELFNTIDYRSSSSWYSPPKGIDVRMICSRSGDVPTELCTEKIEEYFIPGVSRNIACRHLAPVWVNARATQSYCSDCMHGHEVQQQLFDNLAPELITFYEEEKISYHKIPPHNPACTRIKNESGILRILSPKMDTEMLLEKASPSRIMLKCATPPDVSEVYWYMDDKWIGKSAANSPLFMVAVSGKHKITCTDDKGRSAHISFSVKFY